MGNFLEMQANGQSNIFEIDTYLTGLWSKAKSSKELWRCALDAAVLRTEFRHEGLGIHAIYVLLSLLRSVCFVQISGGMTVEETAPIKELIRREIVNESFEIVDWFASLQGDKRTSELVSSGGDILEFSARTLLLMELVALGIFCVKNSDQRKDEFLLRAADFLTHCMTFKATQRPLSDNYAASVLNVAIAAQTIGVSSEKWLFGVAKWVADCHENGSIGLAKYGASVNEELWRTVAAGVENDAIARNGLSSLSVAVLDAACLLKLKNLYEDAHHDFRSVEVLPYRVLPLKSPDEFSRKEMDGVQLVMKDDYWDDWRLTKGWQNSDSHLLADRELVFDHVDETWIPPALSVIMRDRWWLLSLGKFAGVAGNASAE
jgi:hypothetical protein